MENKDYIYHGDCLEHIEKIPDESVHMIITSPPYYVGKEYNEGAEYKTDDVLAEWTKFKEWLNNIFVKCNRILVPGGKLAINIDDRHVGLKTFGRNVTFPTHAELICALNPLYDYKEMILWKKIRNAHATGGSNRMLGSYGRFRSPGEIPILQEVEYILLFRKLGKRKVNDELRKKSALTPDEFKSYGMQIWDVRPEKDRSHPAPFPIDIPYRLIKLFTFVGDVIYDPFMGSGTTAVAAKRLSRHYLGSELDDKFYQMCQNRLGNVNPDFLAGYNKQDKNLLEI